MHKNNVVYDREGIGLLKAHGITTSTDLKLDKPQTTGHGLSLRRSKSSTVDKRHVE